MPRVQLAAYVVRVHDLGTNTFDVISSFDDGKDLLEWVQRYLESRSHAAVNEATQARLFQIATWACMRRCASGTIMSGHYGYEADIVDVATGNLNYGRQVFDAELVPLYFRFDLPRGRNRGILFLQRFGNRGVKGVLCDDMEEAFADEFEGHELHVDPLASKSALDSLLRDAKTKALRFVSYDLSTDITDNVQTGDAERLGHMEIRMQARWGDGLGILDRVRGVLSRELPVSTFFEYCPPGVDPETIGTVKVDVEVHGRKRTVDLMKPDLFHAIFDISEEVVILASGHPSTTSIHELASTYLELVAESVYPGGLDA